MNLEYGFVVMNKVDTTSNSGGNRTVGYFDLDLIFVLYFAGFLHDIAESISSYPLCGQLCEACSGHCELCPILPDACLSYKLYW